MQKTPTIAELVAMDDTALADVLGFSNKLLQAKEDLAKLATLSGAAREEAEDRISSMLTPNIYPSEISYIYDDAQRRAKSKKSGKEELDSVPTPADI